MKESDPVVFSDKLLSGAPVCELTGDEFEKIEGKSFLQQIKDYFSVQGCVIATQFGNVYVDDKGIKNDMHHGMSRTKAAAFAAIKPTLENGTVILPLNYYAIHGKKKPR